MKLCDLWEQAKSLEIRTSGDIVGGFDVGFDARIPEETKDALMRFAYWVEDRYAMPVTLWVDFRYRHYLLDKNRKRVGFLFYWADFATFPVFENEADIPVIELAVRTERWSIEEVLTSFIEAISHYYAWLTNRLDEDFTPDPHEVENILRSYLNSQQDP